MIVFCLRATSKILISSRLSEQIFFLPIPVRDCSYARAHYGEPEISDAWKSVAGHSLKVNHNTLQGLSMG